MEIIDRTVKSKRPPKQKNVNWIDTSGNKPVIKVFNNGRWSNISGSGGSNSIVSVDINNMPNTLSPNIIYDFGELNQDIEFPEFEATEGYGTYTILFDTTDDIEINFDSEVIWQDDSPDGSEGNHIEICIHSIGDKYYGYYTEWELPAEVNYLTFTAVEDNSSVGFRYWVGPGPGTCPDLEKNMEYSLDNGETWETYVISNNLQTQQLITLEHAGDSVMFRGNNETLAGTENRQYTGCSLRGKVAASGDITSLLNGKGGDIPVPERCFALFFFTSDALTSSPNLPSKILGKECYNGMFVSCSNLSSVTCLATDISAEDCTNGWMNGVSQTGTFTKAVGMNDWTTGDSGIPEGWTVESL